MTKRECLAEQLRTVREEERDLFTFLKENSNLPGPRGNIELAFAFADDCVANFAERPTAFQAIYRSMAAVSASEADTNDPGEIIPFCAAVALGAYAAREKSLHGFAVSELRRLAADSRWRLREGVAMGLQELLSGSVPVNLALLGRLARDPDPLVVRAAVAAMAEPRMLTDSSAARTALEFHRLVLERVAAGDFREDKEAFRVLVKGLSYSLSVVIAAAGEAGFRYLRTLAASEDAVMRKIVRENLKKARLSRANAAETAAIKALL